MKIVAGMGSIDDYKDYVHAGADEVFIGYVPQYYQIKYGLNIPINRREVCFYNVQIGSRSELEILKEYENEKKVPVTIAINGLNYPPQVYPMLEDVILECLEIGFKKIIIADFALLVYLKNKGIDKLIDIHVSGELGEMNHYLIDELSEINIKRLIVHRKVSREIIYSLLDNKKIEEYEVFLLNEMCHFNGAYCNSIHCDERVPMCKMPYELSNKKIIINKEANEIIGSSGCGLCSLWWMRDAGVTHLKIVGRGNYSEYMKRDIEAVQTSLDILRTVGNETEFTEKIREKIFAKKCSKACYYCEN